VIEYAPEKKTKTSLEREDIVDGWLALLSEAGIYTVQMMEKSFLPNMKRVLREVFELTELGEEKPLESVTSTQFLTVIISLI